MVFGFGIDGFGQIIDVWKKQGPNTGHWGTVCFIMRHVEYV